MFRNLVIKRIHPHNVILLELLLEDKVVIGVRHIIKGEIL